MNSVSMKNDLPGYDFGISSQGQKYGETRRIFREDSGRDKLS